VYSLALLGNRPNLFFSSFSFSKEGAGAFFFLSRALSANRDFSLGRTAQDLRRLSPFSSLLLGGVAAAPFALFPDRDPAEKFTPRLPPFSSLFPPEMTSVDCPLFPASRCQ